MAGPEPTIVVIDDDAAVRDSLAAMLEAEGFAVESFGDARSFLAAYRPLASGCYLIDVRMPGMDGLVLLAELARRPDAAPAIMITGHGDVPMAVEAMKIGAVDFIEKPFAPEVILTSIRTALAGQAQTMPPEDVRPRLARLTEREREVLEQLVVGLSNKAIGQELGISPRTVEIHRARVMEKMQADSLSHLVRLALAAGIDPERPGGRPGTTSRGP
jgi:two-component system response regulator FixJ